MWSPFLGLHAWATDAYTSSRTRGACTSSPTQKNRMGRGQTHKLTDRRTSRLLDQIGPVAQWADSMKKVDTVQTHSPPGIPYLEEVGGCGITSEDSFQTGPGSRSPPRGDEFPSLVAVPWKHWVIFRKTKQNNSAYGGN